MKIKVACPCGSRFEFEVEPVHGRMPVTIQCPTCGVDATELANRMIGAQSPVGSPTLKSSLRVSGHAPEAADSPAAPAVTDAAPGEMCRKHYQEQVVDQCRVCGKPICMKCMEQFGYICSAYCKEQAAQQKIVVPKCPHQFSVVSEKEHAILIKALAAVGVLASLLVAGWAYYSWVLTVPKVVYSGSLDSTNNPGAISLVSLVEPGRICRYENHRLSLYDISEKKELWSLTVAKESDPRVDSESAGSAQGGPSAGSANSSLDWAEDWNVREALVVQPKEIWLLLASQVLRVDRLTGMTNAVIPLPQPVRVLAHDADSILAVSEAPSRGNVLTRIAFDSGKVETETTSIPKANASEPNAKPRPGGRVAAARPAVPAAATPAAAPAKYVQHRVQILPAGANALGVEVNLLDEQTAYVQALKPVAKSVMNSSLNAAQSMEAAHEILGDLQRERNNGIREDNVSRFQVTLHRWFAGRTSDWMGDVHGPPSVFPLKTVDILCAGTNVLVFNKENKLVWKAPLVYPIVASEQEFSRIEPPCLETSDALYFADQGMLTRFDLSNGNVKWRLTSVGIHEIQQDERGRIYVASTTASPERIQYSLEPDLERNIQPVILQIEPDSGRVVWRLERFGDDCYISGKFLYVTRTIAPFVLANINNAEANCHLYRLDTSNGRTIWDHYERQSVQVMANQNWILLQSHDGYKVLNFFSF